MSVMEQLAELEKRLTAVEGRQSTMEKQLELQKTQLDTISTNTSEMLHHFKTFTAAFQLGYKFTSGLTKLIQWIAAVLVAGGVIYTFISEWRLNIGIIQR